VRYDLKTTQGYDEPPLSDFEKSKLRHQALCCLKAELSAWARLLESAPPEARPMIATTLRYLQEDADLVSNRDEAELAQLPTDEQEAFTRFWADVAAMLQKAETNPGPNQVK